MEDREWYTYYVSYVVQDRPIPRFFGDIIHLDYEIDCERDLSDIRGRLSWNKSFNGNDIVIINWKLLEY